MGASNSHILEYEEAKKSFSEEERTKLDNVFNKMSSDNGRHVKLLEKESFQSYTSWLLPEQVSGRFFKEMCGIQASLEREDLKDGEVSIEAFFITLSHFLKKGKEEKAHIFHLVASDSNNVTSLEVATLVKYLLNAYATSFQSTPSGKRWKLDCSKEAGERFVIMSTRTLVEEKEEPCVVAVGDLVSWFTRFPLIEHMFGAVVRACFIDLDGIVDNHPHGLDEGCEETVGHIYHERSHILVPCKLEVNFDETDTLLDIPTLLTVNNTLPSNLRHRWRLLFSTKTHGESFQSLRHQITHQGPSLIVVKDRGGHIFGGFASESWTVKSQFGGDSRCFMFGLQPSLAIYHSTGYNDNFMYLNTGMQTLPNGLGMGGQLNYFGLWLDENFGTGHCKGEPCSTYGNPLLSSSENFSIDELEVWGLGIPPERELRQQSVLDAEVEAKAFLEIAGKHLHSEGFREPDK